MCAFAGDIVLTMWRTSGNQGTATLIGKNKITITQQEVDKVKVSANNITYHVEVLFIQ